MNAITRAYFMAAGLGLAAFVLFPGGAVSEAADPAAAAVELLERRCFECHSGANNLGGLLLDGRELALKGGKGGPSIVPGKPEESLLIALVEGTNPEYPQMPMDGDALTGEEIQLLRDWIAEGAPYPETAEGEGAPDHWAYQPIERPEPPEVGNRGWPRNPIDAFVLEKLEAEGLAPAPEASKERLMRRVSLDLTGLPPTPAEVDAFLADESPDAYENLVDRLLASPRYGEHRARYWLDAARYADSNGYQVDRPREMYLYRDWVIGAFNQNMPFDRFTIEQLAGDLMPNPSTSQLIATGFNRNTKMNEEGGGDDEEFRRKAVVDRVDTTSTVWLGTTMACAECHDHKYDPISQEEFYSFYAFFNQTEDRGNYRNDPILPVPDETESEAIASVESLIEWSRGNLERVKAGIEPEQREWEQTWLRERPTDWRALDPVNPDGRPEFDFEFRRDQTFVPPAPNGDGVIEIYLESPKMTVHGVRVEFLPPEGGAPARDGDILISEIEIVSAVRKNESTDTPVKIASASATYSHPGHPAGHALDGDLATGWGAAPKDGEPHSILFELGDSHGGFRIGELVYLKIKRPPGAPPPDRRMRVYFSDKPAESRIPLTPNFIAAILRKPESGRSREERELLRGHYLTISPTAAAFEEVVGKLERRRDELLASARSTLVMRELDKMRDTHVHIRGNFLTPGKEVSAAVPAVLHDMRPDRPRNRLGLALWLMDENNPLTARVTVNRFWQQIFGTGLVETSEDFGTRAAPPSHPGLLDWLASEFMESGWDVKHTIRLMVTSAAYRQAARADETKLEKDPANRLLSRGPRFRMDAEMLRDSALAAAGILDARIGGESVFPPHPVGLWKEIGFLRPEFGMSRWPESYGRDRYRRGLYTFWRRTIPHPTFASFDAPSRETCTVKRPRTNTPLQALVALNDPAFFEAAIALAARLIREEDDARERARHAFRLALAREPGGEELEIIAGFAERRLEHYKAHPGLAEAMFDGSPALDVIPAAPDGKAEWAAWTLAANTLLNLDEFLTKG